MVHAGGPGGAARPLPRARCNDCTCLAARQGLAGPAPLKEGTDPDEGEKLLSARIPFFILIFRQLSLPEAFAVPFPCAMNMLSRIHDKARPIGLFLLVMLVILGSSVVERRLMSKVTTSVSSLYQDRLLPATGLFELNNLLYAKQQLLATHGAAPAGARQYLLGQLGVHNQQLDILIRQHQATYLVREEKQVLQAFQTRLNRYNALEAQLLGTDAPPTAAQTAEAARQGQRLHAELSQLNQIQQRVGQQLSQSSLATEGSSQLISNLTIALLVVFTLAIQHALLTSRHPLVPKNIQNFHLN